MAGYSRQDTANNIANGNVIDADDLDNEFNAVEDAFNSTNGHTHDGTPGEGAPITKVGPSQDVIVGASNVLPKANNTIDLGSAAAKFKDAYVDGVGYVDTVNAGVNKYTTITDNNYVVSSGSLTIDVAGDITLDADGGDVVLQDGGVAFGGFTNTANNLVVKSGTTTAATFNGANVDLAGTLDVTGAATLDSTLTVVGNTSISTGDFTVNSGDVDIGGALDVTGVITGNLQGSVTGNVTGNITGNAGTATALQTARTIGGVSFDGTANINLPGVNTAGNQNTTGNAATATKLATARTIGLSGDVSGSVSFDGSANATITAVVADDSHNHVIGNIDGLQAALDAKADDSTTISAGGGLTGGGSIGANRTISHADTSSVGNVNNSGNTFIQDLTFDGYGHVTAVASGTVSLPSVYDATIGVLAGGGMSGGGYFTTNQSFNENVTISHADTSSQGSVNNSSGTVIQDITLDTYGHITAIGSVNLDGRYYTESESDGRYAYKAGSSGQNFSANNIYAAAFFYSSDERLKDNVAKVESALDVVSKLQGVSYTWKEDGKQDIGFIAQEVQKVIPEAVVEHSDVYEDQLTVNAAPIIAYLVEAIKELKAEVESLK